MKNSNVLISTIVVIFMQISFSVNGQSGKVDFKAEQPVSLSINYSPFGGEVGIVKTKTLVKFNILKGERIPDFKIKKKYEFVTIEKSKLATKMKTTEFKSFIKTNKYQFSETNKD
ncbi:MAG: hypothetical protein AB8F94_24360 [Saprospiraceae bacterium]